MNVRADGASEAETIRAGLFLSKRPRVLRVVLFRQQILQKAGPLNACLRFDCSAVWIELEHAAQACRVQKKMVREKLLPAHRVTPAADG